MIFKHASFWFIRICRIFTFFCIFAFVAFLHYLHFCRVGHLQVWRLGRLGSLQQGKSAEDQKGFDNADDEYDYYWWQWKLWWRMTMTVTVLMIMMPTLWCFQCTNDWWLSCIHVSFIMISYMYHDDLYGNHNDDDHHDNSGYQGVGESKVPKEGNRHAFLSLTSPSWWWSWIQNEPWTRCVLWIVFE